MAKTPTDRVNVTLRITEHLRARLEAAAEASGQSLNSEITARLERAFEAKGILAELFGDERIFGCLMTMALALKQVQHRIGDADWKSDRIAQDAVSEAVITVLSAYTKPEHASRTWKIDDPFPDPKATAIGRASAEAALRLADPPLKTDE